MWIISLYPVNVDISFITVNVPLPSTSLKKPIIDIATKYDKPVLRPSLKLSNTLFLEAYDNALPRIIQLTTIKGKYIPNASYKEALYFLRSNSTTVTRVDIIII